MNLKEEIRKAANDCEHMFNMADELRKLADKIEDRAGNECEWVPAVFIEEKGNMVKFYISESNIVPNEPESENFGPYMNYMSFSLDKWALEDLLSALVDSDLI